MIYYSIIYKLYAVSPAKYFVKHCLNEKEYLNFIDEIYRNKDIEKIATIIDKKLHCEVLDSLIDRITRKEITEESLRKEIKLIQNKICSIDN